MLPKPVRITETGELQGGKPVAVLVRVEPARIVVMTATIVWTHGAYDPELQGAPFATLPLNAPASRVAELVSRAWGSRVSAYRWCPRCRRAVEPEHMSGPLCHGCSTKFLGTIY